MMTSHNETCWKCGSLVLDDFCASCATPAGDAVARVRIPEPANFTESEQDVLLASQLADHLRAGGDPAPQSIGIRLDPGEVGYGTVRAEMHVYTGADYVEPGSMFVAFGSPMWMLGSLGASAAYNSHRRRKAQQAAAVQWRLENQGVMHFTNRRVALQGINGWVDLYFEHFRALTPTDAGVIAHFADWPMIRLVCSSPAWSWVMLSRYVLGETPHIVIPPELEQRLFGADG